MKIKKKQDNDEALIETIQRGEKKKFSFFQKSLHLSMNFFRRLFLIFK